MAQQGRKKISHLETCFENHMFIQPSSFLFSNGFVSRVAYPTQATATQQQHQKQHHTKRTWKTTKYCNQTELLCIACGAVDGFCGDGDVDGQDMHIFHYCCHWCKKNQKSQWPDKLKLHKKYLLFSKSKKMHLHNYKMQIVFGNPMPRSKRYFLLCCTYCILNVLHYQKISNRNGYND